MIEPEVQSVERGESPVRFGVLTAIGVTLLFQFGAQMMLLRYDDPSLLPVITALAQLTLMLLPALYAARAQDLAVRELFRLRRVSPGFAIATIAGIIMLWPLVQTYLIVQELYLVPDGWYDAYRELQHRLEELYDRLLPGGDASAVTLSIVAGALVPGICEEMVFRGATQRSFERRMRPIMAIVLTSLLFAALHLQPHNFVPLVVLGMFLGLVSWASDSVYPAIIGHFFFNAVMVAALYTMRAAGEKPSAHTESDLTALLPAVAVCVVGLVFVLRWLIRRGRERDALAIPAVLVSPTLDTPTTTDEH